MEIILKQDISGLGHADDIIKVKKGYANNYLIPRGFASLATESAKKIHAENMRQRAFKEARIKEEALKIMEQLKNKKLKIGAKTSTSGKIFGSVNTIQLAEEIAKKGFDIDRKKISIKEEPVKEVGTFTVVIKLHREVVFEMPFEVVSE